MSIPQRALQLLRDDSYAMAFQSIGQYRAALLLQAARGEQLETAANELLPCPFCGGTEAFVERLDNCSAYVMCSSMLDEHSCCTARGPVGIQDDDGEEIPGAAAAISAWNQRAAPGNAGPIELLSQASIELNYLNGALEHFAEECEEPYNGEQTRQLLLKIDAVIAAYRNQGGQP